MKTYRLVFRAVDVEKFNEVKLGLKTIETRAATPKYRNVQAQDELTFVCGKLSFSKRIAKVRHFDTLDTMFDALPLESILPSVVNRIEAYQVYYSFHGYKDKIAEYGILAFELEQ